MSKQRKRKKRVDKTEIFEYSRLLLQFSPEVPFKVSYDVWVDYMRMFHPEPEFRFVISKCCRNPDCRKLFVFSRVDPQPEGSGFNLQFSETKTSDSKELDENTVADLVFEKFFSKICKSPFESSEFKGLKILSLTEFANLCEGLVRGVHYTRMIFEVEKFNLGFLLMEGDSIYLDWLRELQENASKIPLQVREENTLEMEDLLRQVRNKFM